MAYPPSSTKSFFVVILSVALLNLVHSSSVKSPTLNLCKGIDVSVDKSLSISCSAGISSEKKATPSSLFIAFSVILRTKLVFPIAGRAAIIIKSPLPNPLVLSFRFLNPVSVPINLEFPKAFRRFISSNIDKVISLDSLKSSLVLFWVISYNFFSTKFITSSTGKLSSIVTFLIVVAKVAKALLVERAFISPR